MREKKKGKRKEKNSTRDRKRKQLGEKKTREEDGKDGEGAKEHRREGQKKRKERKEKIIKGPDDDITCVEEDVTYVGASQARGDQPFSTSHECIITP